MLGRPRDYRPLVAVLVFESVVGLAFFRGRIARALLGVAQESRWTALDTGLVVTLALGLALAVWLWVRVENG
jgi:hypothetical protein